MRKYDCCPSFEILYVVEKDKGGTNLSYALTRFISARNKPNGRGSLVIYPCTMLTILSFLLFSDQKEGKIPFAFFLILTVSFSLLSILVLCYKKTVNAFDAG